MADDIDLANALAENQVSRALERMREKNAASGKVMTKNCVECGDEVPIARRKLGFQLCVPCAEDDERKKSRFAG